MKIINCSKQQLPLTTSVSKENDVITDWLVQNNTPSQTENGKHEPNVRLHNEAKTKWQLS